jgi:hypothetical protein
MKNLHLLLIALVIAFPLTGEAGVTRKGVTKCGKWVSALA